MCHDVDMSKSTNHTAQGPVVLHREAPDNWCRHTDMTPEQIRERDRYENSAGTLEDPDEQWEGASAPFDMYLKERNPGTETCCTNCFVIVLKSVAKSGLCGSCQWDLGNS